MALYKVKRGDTRPLQATLRDGRGAFNLTNVQSVVFSMRLVDETGPASITGSATPVVGQEARGKFYYSWAEGETDTVGMYDAEVRVTMSDGEILTFPSEPSDFRVEITQSLAP